jgi:hypothetical protein
MNNYFVKTTNRKCNLKKAHLIVLLFVIAHALLCLLFRIFNLKDALGLTLLTVMMIYSVTRFFKAPIDVFIGLAFLSCFAGFFLGTKGAEYLNILLPHFGFWNNVLTTAIVTELLGLINILLVFKSGEIDKK